MVKRALLLAAFIVAGSSGVASAANDFRAGSQSDPVGDGTLTYEYSGVPGQLGRAFRWLDVTKADVAYDAGTGQLDVGLHGASLAGYHREGFEWGVTLTAPNAQGKCDGIMRAGDYRVFAREEARSTDEWGVPDGPGDRDVMMFAFPRIDGDFANNQPERAVAFGTYETTEQTHDGPRMHFTQQFLVNRNIRCVSDVFASLFVADTDRAMLDFVDDFTIGGPVTAPTIEAPTNVIAAGGRITWNKVGDNNNYVVASSAAAEGDGGRNTTYTDVSGTSWNPPADPGRTKYYSVRVAGDNSLWSRPEVAIDWPSKASDPPTNPDPKPPIVTPPVVNPPVLAIIEPPRPTPPAPPVNNTSADSPTPTPAPVTAPVPILIQTQAPLLNIGTAKKALAKRLAKKFGKEYKNRKRFVATCDNDDSTHVTCDVSWRTNRYKYSGRVRVRLANGSTKVSYAIKHTRRR